MKLPICNFDAKVALCLKCKSVFFPTKILSINSVLAPNIVQKTKVGVSRKLTPRYTIDTNKSLKLSKIPETLTLR